jgi:hypothetical protein
MLRTRNEYVGSLFHHPCRWHVDYINIISREEKLMTLKKDDEKSTTRRGFVQNIAAGATGMAIASALTELGAPALAAAQESKQAASPFFKNPPPWPKGTIGNKYDHLFCTKLKENSITDVVAGPQAYFRGESDLPGAKINMGWQMFVKPYKL